MKQFNILLTAILFVVLSSSINAQDKLSNKVSSKDMFAKGSKVLAVYTEYYNSQDSDRDISIIQLNAETGFYLFRGLSLNGNAYLLVANGH